MVKATEHFEDSSDLICLMFKMDHSWVMLRTVDCGENIRGKAKRHISSYVNIRLRKCCLVQDISSGRSSEPIKLYIFGRQCQVDLLNSCV